MFESVSFASAREVGRARSTLSFDGIRHGWKKGSIELAARDQGLRLPLIVRCWCRGACWFYGDRFHLEWWNLLDLCRQGS